MQTFAVALLLASSLLASAQDSPTIKGHKIGESVNDYLTIEDGGTEKAAHALTECAALLNNPKERRKQAYRAEICKQTADALDGQTVIFGGPTDFMRCQFASRKLVWIQLHMAQDFSKVEGDLIEKYGHPDLEEQVPFQNGFGAQFLHPRASWVKRPDVIVIASEDGETTWGFGPDGNTRKTLKITVLITDRPYAESLAQKEQQRPNSLN
jgi:hypothetical protein